MAIKRKFPARTATVHCSGGCRAKRDENGGLLCAYGCVACGACVEACRFGAVQINDLGCAEVDEEKCIGCKYCMAACPYQVRTRNSKTGEVDKCRFCTVSAETSGTKMCSCVEACLTGARMFGDLDDPDSEINQAIAKYHAQPLADNLTVSKIYYVR